MNDNDYICISDFTKIKEGKSISDDVIRNWLRNRITLEFLGTRNLYMIQILMPSNSTGLKKSLVLSNFFENVSMILN